MTIIQIRNVGTAASGTAGVTPGLPTGTQAGDFLVMVTESNVSEPVTAADGWTVAPSAPVSVAATSTLGIFYKFAGSGESAPSVADSGDHTISRIIGFRNVRLDDPFNVTTFQEDTTSSTSATAPAVTTTANDTMVLVAVSTGLDANSTTQFTFTNSTLTNLEEQMDNVTNSGGGGGFGLATGRLAAAGTTGTTSITLGTASAKGLWVAALNPVRVVESWGVMTL
jgi:hypothetical protein